MAQIWNTCSGYHKDLKWEEMSKECYGHYKRL